MEKEIRSRVKYANTAKNIWNDLRERFEKKSASRAYELKQLLTTIRKDKISTSTYYINTLGQDKLCHYHAKMLLHWL